MGAHALLSASASQRWLNCTPSARLEEQLPDSTSVYAEEGTLAHNIAELKLRRHFTEPMGPRTFSNRMKKLKEHHLYQEEMQKHTDAYLDYIKQLAMRYPSSPFIAVEKRLDYSHIAPEGFGTGDCVLIYGDTLHIIDFKYGQGIPVAAKDNTQMLLYALGALRQYETFYPIAEVEMAIFQPRRDNLSEWRLPVEELRAGGEEIKPLAQLAFDGAGEKTPGPWCRFCRANPRCRAQCESMLVLEAVGPPDLLTDQEIGQVLGRLKQLRDWSSDVEECALKAILSGGQIPGWKAVAGRSIRQFSDQEAAFQVVLDNGFDEALLYERKAISLAAVEKLIGEAEFEALLGDQVVKPPGKPTLVPADDPREPYRIQPTAAEVFAAGQSPAL